MGVQAVWSITYRQPARIGSLIGRVVAELDPATAAPVGAFPLLGSSDSSKCPHWITRHEARCRPEQLAGVGHPLDGLLGPLSYRAGVTNTNR
jgi:hypothetical protein